MRVIGITGSMASGKSTLTKLLLRRGVMAFDADKAVHRLIVGDAFNPILQQFPEAAEEFAGQMRISRKKLGEIVFVDKTAFYQLEQILHPMVQCEIENFIKSAHRRRYNFVILDIPLLFENRLQKYCDVILLADVPVYIQKMRLRIRHLTEQRQQAILSRQMPLWQKRKMADSVIAMNQPLGCVRRIATQKVEEILRGLAVHC